MKYAISIVLVAGLCIASSHNAAGADRTLYVATDGDDAAPGTKDKPLATLSGARDAVRKLKATGKAGNITVRFGGGVYRLSRTVVFGLEDSAGDNGTVIYSAAPGQTPLFSGGRAVTGWVKLKTPLEHLPTKARGKVYVADLPAGLRTCKTLFDGLGRLPRAKLPPVIPNRRIGSRTTPDDFLTVPLPRGVLKAYPNLADGLRSASSVMGYAAAGLV